MATWSHRTRVRVGLVLSVMLVLFTAALGLAAGRNAGQLAVDTHIEDRIVLQRTLGSLTEQWMVDVAARLRTALTSQGAEEGYPSWPAVPRSRETLDRLDRMRLRAPMFDDGFLLISSRGVSLGSTVLDLPSDADPAWASLRRAIRDEAPLKATGVLTAAGRPVLSFALDVPLSDGTRGHVIGFLHGESGTLQRYVSELSYGTTGTGWVLDDRGYVVAAKDFHLVGKQLPDPRVRSALSKAVRSQASGLVQRPGGSPVVASYAAVGGTGWLSVTMQDADEFLAPLESSARRSELAVLALLLLAGGGLVILHRGRTQTLRHLSVRDELTGLLNRRGWFEQAALELQRAERAGEPRVIVYLDIDGLKQINDVLGHVEGDKALRDVASLLTSAARSTDVAGRLGGDEFVLLLGRGGDAVVLLQRVVDSLAAWNAGGARAFELRLSLGAGTWSPDQPCSLDELIHRADEGMYADKQSRPLRHDGVVKLPVPRTSLEQVEHLPRR